MSRFRSTTVCSVTQMFPNRMRCWSVQEGRLSPYIAKWGMIHTLEVSKEELPKFLKSFYLFSGLLEQWGDFVVPFSIWRIVGREVMENHFKAIIENRNKKPPASALFFTHGHAICQFFMRIGLYDLAIDFLQSMKEDLVHSFEEEKDSLARILLLSGHLLQKKGNHVDAEIALREAYEVFLNLYGSNHKKTLSANVVWIGGLIYLGRSKEVQPMIERITKNPDLLPRKTYFSYQNVLWGFLYAQKKYKRAYDLGRRLLEEYKMEYDEQSSSVISFRVNLSVLCRECKKYDEALVLLHDACTQIKKVFGPTHFRLAQAYFSLAQLYSEMGDGERSFTKYEEGVFIFDKNPVAIKSIFINVSMYMKLLLEKGESEQVIQIAMKYDEMVREGDIHYNRAFYFVWARAYKLMGEYHRAFEIIDELVDSFASRDRPALLVQGLEQKLNLICDRIDTPFVLNALRDSLQLVHVHFFPHGKRANRIFGMVRKILIERELYEDFVDFLLQHIHWYPSKMKDNTHIKQIELLDVVLNNTKIPIPFCFSVYDLLFILYRDNSIKNEEYVRRLLKLAKLCHEHEQNKRAMELYIQAHEVSLEVFGEEHQFSLVTCSKRAHILEVCGDAIQAIVYFERVYEMCRGGKYGAKFRRDSMKNLLIQYKNQLMKDKFCLLYSIYEQEYPDEVLDELQEHHKKMTD